MSVELIISLASAIVVALSGVIVYQQKRIDKLQDEKYALAQSAAEKFETIATRQAESSMNTSTVNKQMYEKFVSEQKGKK